MKKTKIAVLAVLCFSFVLSGLFMMKSVVSAEQTVEWNVSEKTTNLFVESFTTKQFDYWNNSNVEFTSDGVLAVSKTASYNGNVMNIYGPFGVRNGELSFVFSIPLRNESGEFVDENYKCDNITVSLYSGAQSVASVTVWGNGYNHEYSAVNATFAVGSKSIANVKLPKNVLWENGRVKMGFSLEKGWLTELYNSAYAPVSESEYKDALSSYTFDEITRIQIAGANWGTGLNTAPKVLLKELNGQSLARKQTASAFTDCFFASDVEVADETFMQGETYKFRIADNPSTDVLNKTGCTGIAKTDGTYSFGAVVADLGNGKTKGDIGWNSDGKKGPCTESGIYLTLHNPDGTTTEYSSLSAWNLSFVPEQAGEYTADFTLLTSNGFVCTRSCSFTVNASAKSTDALITAIDLNYPETVASARASYDKLSAEEKGKVTDYNLLEKAERLSVALAELKNTFAMVLGASVRLDEPAGLRFSATLNKTVAETFNEEGVTLEFGTLIAPSDYMTDESQLTLDAEFKFLNIVRTVWDEKGAKDGELRFNGAIIGLFEYNYTRTFVGKAYAKFSFNGNEVVVYATPNDNARSVKAVATMALTDEKAEYTDKQREVLRRYANAVDITE